MALQNSQNKLKYWSDIALESPHKDMKPFFDETSMKLYTGIYILF